MDAGIGPPSRTFRDPLATRPPPTPVPRGGWPQGKVQVPKGETLLSGDTPVPLTGKPPATGREEVWRPGWGGSS